MAQAKYGNLQAKKPTNPSDSVSICAGIAFDNQVSNLYTIFPYRRKSLTRQITLQLQDKVQQQLKKRKKIEMGPSIWSFFSELSEYTSIYRSLIQQSLL